MKESVILTDGTLSEGEPLTDEEWAQATPVPSLWRLRTLMGMSEQDFCEKFGVTVSTLSAWEDGREDIDDEISFQVFELFMEFKAKQNKSSDQ